MWPLVAAAALKAGGTLLKSAAPAIGNRKEAKRSEQYDTELEKREGDLYSGNTGYTKAQRQQMMGESLRSAQTSNRGLYDDLSRQAATSGGGMNQIRRGLAAQEGNDAAKSMAKINVGSQQQAVSEADKVRREVLAQSKRMGERTEENVAAIGDTAQSAGEIIPNFFKAGDLDNAATTAGVGDQEVDLDA